MSNDSDNKWLRSNGTEWIRYGPAIFGSCKRIELRINHGQGGEEFKVSDKDKNFLPIQSWIRKTFEKKLDMAPKEPSFKAVYAPILLVLFSSDNGRQEDMLISIPLSARMLGSDEITFQDRVKELRSMMIPMK